MKAQCYTHFDGISCFRWNAEVLKTDLTGFIWSAALFAYHLTHRSKKKWGQGQHGRILNLFSIKDCLSVEVCHKEKEKAINENYEIHQAEKTSNMKVTERTNNLYRQNLCFSSQGNLRANLRANRNWFSFYIHMHRTFYMFTTSCKPVKAIYKIYGVCRVKKPHFFPNSSLMTMFLSCLISSYIYIFCDQIDIPQWRGPKASVKIENNIENTLCVCSVELQQAQMWLSAILYQLWGFWKHTPLFPAQACFTSWIHTETVQ